MTIYKLGEAAPTVHESVFVADSANLIGDVALEENSSVWFGATIRGDNEPITSARAATFRRTRYCIRTQAFRSRSNTNVTIGHQAMLHGCTIKRRRVDRHSGRGLEWSGDRPQLSGRRGRGRDRGQGVSDDSLILGAPAKVVRELTETDIANLQRGAASYA